MSKKSIRFFNDREVRAVWDEENTKWWFSYIVQDMKEERQQGRSRGFHM